MTWKKRIISIVLCLCALLCAASVRAEATDEHSHPICGASHKDIGNHTGTCDNVTWTAWDGTDMDTNADDIQLTAGHYYLSDNVTLDSTIEISGEVYLCLNGCTLSYSKYVSGDSNSVGGMVLLDNSAVLNVCDCKGDGNIVHDYNYDSNWRKSTVRVKRGSTLNLYGGSVIMERGKAVAAVDLDYDTGANFYMYGGKVENKSTHYDPYSTYAVHVYGNSSQDSGSNVKIYGGEIICKNGYGIRVFYEARPSILVAGGKIESGNKAIEVSYAALTLQGKPTISTTDQDYAAIGLSQSSPLIKVTSDFAPETPVSVGKTSLTTGTEFAEPAADNETLAAEARAFVSHEAGYFIENNANGRLQFTACAITGQPNEENGYTVTANGTPGYQWYTATKGEIPVTESNTTKHYSYLRYFDWTGEWFASSIPDANTGLFTIQMGEGDTLKLDFNYVSVEKVTLTDGTQRVIEGEQAGNNSYTITVGEAGEYTLKVDATANGYEESGRSSPLEFTATMTGYVAGQSMPGQTDRKLSTEGLGGNYLCKVTWESKTELTSLSVHVHDWQPATCTTPKTCSVCKTTEGEAKGHSWVDATCTTPKTCSVCKTTEGEALGHDWNAEWSKDDDHHWHKCKNCNAINTTSKAPHDWNSGKVTTPATCTTPGEKTFTCTACSATKTEPVPATGHTYNQTKVEDKYLVSAATCTDKAVYYKSCVCGEKGTATFEYGNSLGHDFSVRQYGENDHWMKCSRCDATDTKEAHSGGTASCTAKAKCSVCGQEYGGLKAHDFANGPYRYDGEQHWKKCANCDATDTKEAHSGGEATCTQKAVCEKCGQKYGDLKAHDFANGPYQYDGEQHWYKCANCTATTEPVAHTDFTAWKSDRSGHWHECSTCGYKTAVNAHTPDRDKATETTPQLCTECGYVIAPATHPVHTWVFVAETPATCNAAGEREHYKCTCGRTSFKNGDVYDINEDASVLTIEKNSANHTGAPDSEWHSDSANHWQEYTCCYARANEAAHSGGAATCTAQAVCQVCGRAYGPLAAHDWGAWKVTTPATKDAPGVETRTCTHNSAHTETRSIPKLSTTVYTVSEDTKIAQIEAKVDGLDKILELNENKALVNDGKSVGVSLTVKNTASSGVSEKIKEKLAGSSLVGLRLELTVEKTVTANGVVESKQTIPDAGVLLKTTITLPAELQGKSGYVVYRLHDENVHVLTETANENGEFISVSADKTQITICARLYSEYVIAYQTSGSSGGGYHPVNPTPVKATSANTGDAGVLLYGVTAALSLTGTAWLGAKSRKH